MSRPVVPASRPVVPASRPVVGPALSRRTALLAALGLTACAQPTPRPPVAEPAPGITIDRSDFRSQARGGVRTGWALAFPGDSPTGLPVWVLLHGLHNDHRTAFGRSGLDLDGALADLAHRSGRRIAVAAVDGGTTYWHRRPNGEDAGAMVVEEFLPMLRKRGLTRVALGGWSMGGYGALRLAGILGPQRIEAVTAMSPALWLPGSEASKSGFDDAAEYAEFSIMAEQAALNRIPVRVDCGRSDPFYAATKAYVSGFAEPISASFGAGGHDRDYWRRTAPKQLRFVVDHLVG